METRRLGSLSVSSVGLGCNNFGMRCDERRSAEVVHAALDAGITLFDTADVYGGKGRSEEHLGKALGAQRDEVVVATKFANPMDDSGQRQGASARWIVEAVEGSLRRLGTDRIDLYQQHVPDHAVPLDETVRALDDLVRAGKVLELGHSNFSAPMIDQAAEVAARQGLRPLLELAFAWLLGLPTMASVIAGATSPEQVGADASAATWALTEDDRQQLDAVLTGT